jgi:hypothetical protein
MSQSEFVVITINTARGYCRGLSSSEGPQKHDLTMLPKCNIHTGTFKLGIKLYMIWKAWSRRRLCSPEATCKGALAQRQKEKPT